MSIPRQGTPLMPIIVPAIGRKQRRMDGNACWPGLPNTAWFEAGQLVRMQLNLTQQRVVVFGAARGIGRAIAEEFIREGCVVHGIDRDGSVPPLSSGSPVIQGDVTAYAQMRAFADRIMEVDHLVFSVGVGSGRFGFPFWKLEPSDWTRVLEINLLGAVNVAQ